MSQAPPSRDGATNPKPPCVFWGRLPCLSLPNPLRCYIFFMASGTRAVDWLHSRQALITFRGGGGPLVTAAVVLTTPTPSERFRRSSNFHERSRYSQACSVGSEDNSGQTVQRGGPSRCFHPSPPCLCCPDSSHVTTLFVNSASTSLLLALIQAIVCVCGGCFLRQSFFLFSFFFAKSPDHLTAC